MISRMVDGVTGMMDRFASSAVLLREASRTSRRWQTYASRVGFTGALFGVLLAGIYTAVNNPMGDAAEMGWLGRYIFVAISTALMLLAIGLAPLITSSAIIEETEDRTLEMLVLSKLEPSQILAGKVLSRILILLTVVFGALPVMAMVVTLGGVAPQAVVAVTIHTLLAVVISGSLGAFYGLFTKSPLLAMLASVAYTLPTFWILPLGYVACTGHPNDAVHFSLFAGPWAEDWSSPVALLSHLPSLALIFVIGTRLFELRIAGADIRKAFSGETWSTRAWVWGLGAAFFSALVLPVPVFFAYTLRYGANHWIASVGLVVCVALIWAWWVLALTLLSWTLLRVGVDVVDAMDGVLGGRGKRKQNRTKVAVWSNPVAWREARPAAWSANGGALLATWLLGMLGMFQTGWWLVPGGSLLMGILNTLAAYGLAVWLAARSVEEERRNQSLEVLLTTNLASHRILFGKALGVMMPTGPLLLLSMPFIALGFPHLHMFDLFNNATGELSAFDWFLRGCAAWLWTLPLWLVLIGGSLLIGLRVKQQRSGFAVAAGLFLAAVGLPGAFGRIFENVPLIAHPCRLISPALAGGADLWHYAVSIAVWGTLALVLFAWTSIGLRRWISGGLAVLLAFHLATPAAQAQPLPVQDGFVMVAEPLGDGLVRADQWAAVRVKIVNQGRKAQGMLTLVERSGTEQVTFQRPVELAEGMRKDVILLYRPNSSGRDRSLALDANGRHAEAGFRVRVANVEEATVGVLGVDLMGIQAIREAEAGGIPGPRPREINGDDAGVKVGLIEPGVLPSHSAGYAAFDQLVWPGADPSTLTPPQIRALTHWVADGGHLVLTVTENWKVLAASELEPLLPLQFQGTVDTVRHQPVFEALGAPRAVNGTAPMAVGILRNRVGQRTFLRASTSDGLPAWVTSTYGLGSVSVLTFDPRVEPLKSAVPTEVLWRTLLALPAQRELLTVDATTTLSNLGVHELGAGHLAQALHILERNGGTALDGNDEYGPRADYDRQVREWLADIPGVAPLPMTWLLAFSGLYLLVIGPLDWIGLRLLHRQPWTWVTFPTTVVVFSSIALVGTAYTKGDQAMLSTLEVVDVLPGTDLWRGDAFVGVFATGRTPIQVRAGVEDSVAQPLRISGYTPDSRLGAGLGPGTFGYTADQWTMGYSALRWTDEAPGNVALEIVDGVYQIRNDFPFALVDAQVVYRGTQATVYPVGTLQPGQVAKLDETASVEVRESWLYDSPSLERGYLDLEVGRLVLLSTVEQRITPVEVEGVRPSRRDRTLLRVPLGVPQDPRHLNLPLQPLTPPRPPAPAPQVEIP